MYCNPLPCIPLILSFKYLDKQHSYVTLPYASHVYFKISMTHVGNIRHWKSKFWYLANSHSLDVSNDMVTIFFLGSCWSKWKKWSSWSAWQCGKVLCLFFYYFLYRAETLLAKKYIRNCHFYTP